MSKGSWLFGFVCGVAAGWLFAPEKGSELRKKIFADRSKGNTGINPLKRDVVEALREVAESTKHVVNDEIELVKKLMNSTNEVKAVKAPKALPKPRSVRAKRKGVVRKPKSRQQIEE